MKRFSICVCAILFFGLNINISASGVYTGFGIGNTDINIDQGFLPEITNEISENDRALGELFLGYEFDNNFLIEVAYDARGSRAVDVEFDAINLGIGYSFETQSAWSFTAKGGLKFWDLYAERNFIDLIGPGFPVPDQMGEADGQDIFVELGLDYSFKEKFKIGLAYDFTDTDFGDSSAIKLKLKWFPTK